MTVEKLRPKPGKKSTGGKKIHEKGGPQELSAKPGKPPIDEDGASGPGSLGPHGS